MPNEPLAPTDLSVIMSVYHKDQPDALRACLDSLLHQTRPADEILVTVDGPVPQELDAVLTEYAERITLFRLPENCGAAIARQRSLAEVSTTFTAVMDADDVCVLHRFEAQLAALVDDDLDRVGAAEDLIVARRPGVRTEDIAAKVKTVTPFNHPTIMMRTQLARAVGGYRPVALLEDYDFIARMVAHGAKVANLAEPLVYFRVNDAMLQRRLHRKSFVSEWQLQRNLVSYGLISWPRAVCNYLARNTFRVLPPPLLRFAYGVLFRSEAGIGKN